VEEEKERREVLRRAREVEEEEEAAGSAKGFLEMLMEKVGGDVDEIEESAERGKGMEKCLYVREDDVDSGVFFSSPKGSMVFSISSASEDGSDVEELKPNTPLLYTSFKPPATPLRIEIAKKAPRVVTRPSHRFTRALYTPTAPNQSFMNPSETPLNLLTPISAWTTYSDAEDLLTSQETPSHGEHTKFLWPLPPLEDRIKSFSQRASTVSTATDLSFTTATTAVDRTSEFFDAAELYNATHSLSIISKEHSTTTTSAIAILGFPTTPENPSLPYASSKIDTAWVVRKAVNASRLFETGSQSLVEAERKRAGPFGGVFEDSDSESESVIGDEVDIKDELTSKRWVGDGGKKGGLRIETADVGKVIGCGEVTPGTGRCEVQMPSFWKKPLGFLKKKGSAISLVSASSSPADVKVLRFKPTQTRPERHRMDEEKLVAHIVVVLDSRGRCVNTN
ncbi:hypothetical protein HDV05_001093, partial [Chytridiales sp. JEL 0842]